MESPRLDCCSACAVGRDCTSNTSKRAVGQVERNMHLEWAGIGAAGSREALVTYSTVRAFRRNTSICIRFPQRFTKDRSSLDAGRKDLPARRFAISIHICFDVSRCLTKCHGAEMPLL